MSIEEVAHCGANLFSVTKAPRMSTGESTSSFSHRTQQCVTSTIVSCNGGLSNFKLTKQYILSPELDELVYVCIYYIILL